MSNLITSTKKTSLESIKKYLKDVASKYLNDLEISEYSNAVMLDKKIRRLGLRLSAKLSNQKIFATVYGSQKWSILHSKTIGQNRKLRRLTKRRLRSILEDPKITAAECRKILLGEEGETPKSWPKNSRKAVWQL